MALFFRLSKSHLAITLSDLLGLVKGPALSRDRMWRIPAAISSGFLGLDQSPPERAEAGPRHGDWAPGRVVARPWAKQSPGR
jgi:hypothetical protein